jgi:hypothetical protein
MVSPAPNDFAFDEDSLLSPEDRRLMAELEPPHAWEQQPDESAKQFGAFVIYRDLGPKRSLRETARRYYLDLGSDNLPTSSLAQWARTHNWQVRARAWDAELDRANRDAQVERARAAALADVEVAERMRDLVLQRLVTADPRRINLKDVPTWAVAIQRISRTATGQPTDRVLNEHTGPGGGPIQLTAVAGDQEAVDARLLELFREITGDLRKDVAQLVADTSTREEDRNPVADGGLQQPEETETVEYRPYGGAQ